MKKAFTFLAAILITAGLFSQTPAKMTYQAVIRNANGELVSTQVGMKISILQGADADTASEVYSESLRPTPNQSGLLSIKFGGETGWDAIDWSEGTYFIKTETDPTGGSNYTITDISQPLSVPYALYANRSETVLGLTGSETDFAGWDKNANDDFSGNYNDLSNLPDLSVYLTEEQDGDATNELQTLSIREDIISLSKGGRSVKLPSFSGSYEDLIDVPIHLDTDATDDFSGDYNELINTPMIPDVSEAITQATLEDSTAVLRAGMDGLKAEMEELKAEADELKLENGTYALVDSRDNEVYGAVRIGTQVWMTRNLGYLPELHNLYYFQVKSLNSEPTYSIYDYNVSAIGTSLGKETNNYKTYGALYNWYAVAQGNLCPDGWHVPSNSEWLELSNYLGGGAVSGGRLKAASLTYWETPNFGADNASGFTAFPGGYRGYRDGVGTDNDIKIEGNWWTSSAHSDTEAYALTMNHDNGRLDEKNSNKKRGYSVRCLRD